MLGPAMVKRLVAVLTGALVAIVLTAESSSCGGPAVTTSSPAAPATAAPVPSPQVLLDITGAGSNTTQKFSAASDWDLAWSFDCTAALSLPDGQCSFIVHVKDSAGNFAAGNQGVSQLAKTNQGIEHYHVGGTFYLEIQLCCVQGTWAVKVTG
jgi:hypothetical protein